MGGRKWIDGLYQGFQLLTLKTHWRKKICIYPVLIQTKVFQDKLIDLVNDKSPLQSIPVNKYEKKSNIGEITIF